MNKLILFFLLFICSGTFAQTANDAVPTAPPFRIGVNPGWYSNDWSDEKLADIAAGNPDANVNTTGAGIRAFRATLPESFVEQWGYNVRLAAFQHYDALNIKNNTVFLEGPSAAHKDTTHYCQIYDSWHES